MKLNAAVNLKNGRKGNDKPFISSFNKPKLSRSYVITLSYSESECLVSRCIMTGLSGMQIRIV